jgi:hypothetical protein
MGKNERQAYLKAIRSRYQKSSRHAEARPHRTSADCDTSGG